MKRLTLTPYHLFIYHDQPYVLDIETSAVMRLDPPVYNPWGEFTLAKKPIKISHSKRRLK